MQTLGQAETAAFAAHEIGYDDWFAGQLAATYPKPANLISKWIGHYNVETECCPHIVKPEIVAGGFVFRTPNLILGMHAEVGSWVVTTQHRDSRGWFVSGIENHPTKRAAFARMRSLLSIKLRAGIA